MSEQSVSSKRHKLSITRKDWIDGLVYLLLEATFIIVAAFIWISYEGGYLGKYLLVLSGVCVILILWKNRKNILLKMRKSGKDQNDI